MALRDRLNEKAGQWASRRAQRAAYDKRTLLVADHWDGSVQQFFHFMFGYLFPVSLWCQRHPGSAITLRDCGPMNVWIDRIREHGLDVEIIPPGTALHMVVGDRMRHEILKGLDYPDEFERASLTAGGAAVAQLLGLPPQPPANGEGRVVVIDRLSHESFYQSSESETHMSGSMRRSTPNLSEIGGVFEGEVDVVDLARMEPVEQLMLARDTSILIAQHGAGLLHMVWMPPGSTIIEIEPPLPPEAQGIFRKLAACLGHHYFSIPQTGVHDPIDLDSVREVLRTASR